MKIIVFDLDETLGYFTQFGIFWDCLNEYFNQLNTPLTQTDFNNVLDLYPEFLRPNIIDVLVYLKDKKRTNCCNKIMIYTNNQGPKEWCEHIIHYFDNKTNYKLFDQIIAAFKVNGEKVELMWLASQLFLHLFNMFFINMSIPEKIHKFMSN